MTRKDDFVQHVLDFDALTQLNDTNMNTIKTQYLSQPNFTKKAVEYASKSCGMSSALPISEVALLNVMQ